MLRWASIHHPSVLELRCHDPRAVWWPNFMHFLLNRRRIRVTVALRGLHTNSALAPNANKALRAIFFDLSQ